MKLWPRINQVVVHELTSACFKVFPTLDLGVTFVGRDIRHAVLQPLVAFSQIAFDHLLVKGFIVVFWKDGPHVCREIEHAHQHTARLVNVIQQNVLLYMIGQLDVRVDKAWALPLSVKMGTHVSFESCFITAPGAYIRWNDHYATLS
jgi:hypothetical protein